MSQTIVGPFKRHSHASLNEHALMGRMLTWFIPNGTMLDVGSMHGAGALPFLHKGWEVFAFEPDPVNREDLERRFKDKANFHIDPRAVSDKAYQGVPFYQSPESVGISTLTPFRDSHSQICTVDVITVADFLHHRNISKVDYIKIDTEGYDFFVLKGIPWATHTPHAIMCEFEDSKTIPLGYTMHDMAFYLVEKGYFVYVSEWHPVIQYGSQHDWCRFATYPCHLLGDNACGNFLAFQTKPTTERLELAIRAILSNGRRPFWQRILRK